MDQTLLQERIDGRKRAEELFTLAVEEVAALSGEGKRSFWATLHEQIRNLLPADLPESAEQPPMSDMQSRAFGKTKMRYGFYAGKCVDDVPLSYLIMLTEEKQFTKELRRYLASDRIQREMEHVSAARGKVPLDYPRQLDE